MSIELNRLRGRRASADGRCSRRPGIGLTETR
jgi:hypothetical protein